MAQDKDESNDSSIDPRSDRLKEFNQLEGIQNIKYEDRIFGFNGAWRPNIDPALIKPEDFQTLVNLRYNDVSIEGVNGYSFVNTNAISTYVNINSGVQLRTQSRTNESYVVVNATDGSGQGRLYVNKTAIGSTGDFATGMGAQTSGSQTAYLLEDASSGLTGRFSKAPGENIAYANGEESIVWSGEETSISLAYTMSDQFGSDPVDVTSKLTNNRTDSDNTVEIGDGDNQYLLVLTKRPVQSFKFYVTSAATTTSDLVVMYFDGDSFYHVDNTTDNTQVTGKTLAQTGTVTFDNTVLATGSTNSTYSKPYHFDNNYLYAYKIIPGYNMSYPDITDYKWTASGSGTNEYYIEAIGGGDPGLTEPDTLSYRGQEMTIGTVGSLAASEWDWGDNDTLGYNTVYFRSDVGDPDAQGIYDLVISGHDVNATISQITCEYAPQEPSNVWDGVYRTATSVQLEDDTNDRVEDYTVQVAESSSPDLPVGVIMDAFDDDDRLTMLFDDRLSGIQFTMCGHLVNASGGHTGKIWYWNGTQFATLSVSEAGGGYGDNFIDGTETTVSVSPCSLGQSGLMSWDPPDDEVPTTLGGIKGYAYQYRVAAGATGMTDTTAGKDDPDVVIDLITGIPAIKDLPTYSFPVHYQSRLLLCNYDEGAEGNRIDYSAFGTTDVFDGTDSSLDGYQSIYVGGSEHLTSAVQLYNRFGSNLFISLVIFKDTELYLLTGFNPEDFQLYPVSQTIGCPAPDSIATAEIGYNIGESVPRNIILFVSNAGPMVYDGAVLYPIGGIENYFNDSEDECVNYTYLSTCKGWFDSDNTEYNILLPTGTSTTLNTWLCYDLIHKKWFSKDVGDADDVTCGFPVTASNGRQYVYGGTDIGKMVQLENGTAWGSTAIENIVQSGDIFPSGSEWDITEVRRVKHVCKRTDENSSTATFASYVDTQESTNLNYNFVDVATTYADSGTAGYSFVDVTASLADSSTAGYAWISDSTIAVDISNNGKERLVRNNIITNQVGWSHSFKFSFSSSTVDRGMRPVMWGIQYAVKHGDY